MIIIILIIICGSGGVVVAVLMFQQVKYFLMIKKWSWNNIYFINMSYNIYFILILNKKKEAYIHI